MTDYLRTLAALLLLPPPPHFPFGSLPLLSHFPLLPNISSLSSPTLSLPPSLPPPPPPHTLLSPPYSYFWVSLQPSLYLPHSFSSQLFPPPSLSHPPPSFPTPISYLPWCKFNYGWQGVKKQFLSFFPPFSPTFPPSTPLLFWPPPPPQQTLLNEPKTLE